MDKTAAIRFLKADLVRGLGKQHLRASLCTYSRKTDNVEVRNKLAEQLAKERAIASLRGP